VCVHLLYFVVHVFQNSRVIRDGILADQAGKICDGILGSVKAAAYYGEIFSMLRLGGRGVCPSPRFTTDRQAELCGVCHPTERGPWAFFKVKDLLYSFICVRSMQPIRSLPRFCGFFFFFQFPLLVAVWAGQ
jgi:hypothetical protein